MAKYVIYARKSTESEDRQILSIPAQVEELRAHASRRGLVVAEVIEESMSAKDPGRPKFGELMRQLTRGELAGILCWKLDRLARNPIDGAAIMWALSKHQVQEVLTPSRTFTGSSDDVLLMSIEFGMAKKYVDDLSDNVRRGMRARVTRGWFPSRPPQGYIPERNTRTITKDPERFPLLRRAMSLILAGTRPGLVLHTLNRVWGYRTPSSRNGGKPMHKSCFYAMLGNPFYCGLLRFKNEVYEGAHEAMLSPAEFAQIQQILNRNSRPRPVRHEWAYTGLLRCGACGSTMTAGFSRGSSGRRYPYYRCMRGHACGQPHISRDLVDAQYAEWLGRFRISDEVAAWCIEALDGLRAEHVDQSRAINQKRERTRRLVEQQLRNLTEMRLKDVLNDAEYLEQRQRLVLEKKGLEEPLRPLDPFEPAKALITVLNKAESCFSRGTEALKRVIVGSACLNSRVLDKKLLVQAKKPFTMLGEGLKSPVLSAQQDDLGTSLGDALAYLDNNTGESSLQAARLLEARDLLKGGGAVFGVSLNVVGNSLNNSRQPPLT